VSIVVLLAQPRALGVEKLDFIAHADAAFLENADDPIQSFSVIQGPELQQGIRLRSELKLHRASLGPGAGPAQRVRGLADGPGKAPHGKVFVFKE